MSNLGIAKFTRASCFAAQKHRLQTRKGIEAQPYINHPLDVANILAETASITDIDILCAAVLHDTIEDTKTSPDELQDIFGPRVAGIVLEVTDDKSQEKQVRKQACIDHAPYLSAGAKLVKMADLISNMRDIISTPPVNWLNQDKATYFNWAFKVIVGLRGINDRLEGQLLPLEIERARLRALLSQS